MSSISRVLYSAGQEPRRLSLIQAKILNKSTLGAAGVSCRWRGGVRNEGAGRRGEAAVCRSTFLFKIKQTECEEEEEQSLSFITSPSTEPRWTDPTAPRWSASPGRRSPPACRPARWLQTEEDTGQRGGGRHSVTTRSPSPTPALRPAAVCFLRIYVLKKEKDSRAVKRVSENTCDAWLTCEMLGELLLQLGGSVKRFPALFLRQTLVHLPAGRRQERRRGVNVKTCRWKSCRSKTMDQTVKTESTHMMFSTDLGLMKTAMGWSWASCSLLMAFPDTSRIQCLPWERQKRKKFIIININKSVEQKQNWFRRSNLLGDLSDRLHAGSVQVVVVLPRLDELVVLDVFLHLLSGHHEVIVSAIHLVVALRPGCVWDGRRFTLTTNIRITVSRI